MTTVPLHKVHCMKCSAGDACSLVMLLDTCRQRWSRCKLTCYCLRKGCSFVLCCFPPARPCPELASKGAYDTNAVYTLSDLARLKEYARLRGVRIVAEFDMPGHGGWSYGRPDLCLSSCSSVLDVTSDKVYEFLAEFLGEIRTVLGMRCAATQPFTHG